MYILHCNLDWSRISANSRNSGHAGAPAILLSRYQLESFKLDYPKYKINLTLPYI